MVYGKTGSIALIRKAAGGQAMQCVDFYMHSPSLTFKEASIDSAIIQGEGLWSLNSNQCFSPSACVGFKNNDGPQLNSSQNL